MLKCLTFHYSEVQHPYVATCKKLRGKTLKIALAWIFCVPKSKCYLLNHLLIFKYLFDIDYGCWINYDQSLKKGKVQVQYSLEFLHLNIVKIMEIVYHSKPKFTHKTEIINMLHFIFP